MNDPILKVNNIEVVYHHVVLVLKGMSLMVPEGAIVALLGSNGAGKTTTLKAISGLLPLEDGAITDGGVEFMGKPLKGLAPHQIVRSGLFQVLEGRHVFEDLTVEENLVCGAYTRRDRAGVKDDLDKCFRYFPPLKKRLKNLAGYLSGGEQQMLAISRGLLARPKLILLDEPSLGLAPLLVEEIFGIIAEINRQEGTTILLVEQNAQMALSVSNYGYIMENGRVVMDGPTERLLADQDVQEFYLGLGAGGGRKSYREVKHYKRRKRWLS
jgi:branched-chain amino acid transport system ATP-binding protein